MTGQTALRVDPVGLPDRTGVPDPTPPNALEDFDISTQSLADLAVKTLHRNGLLSGYDLSRRLGLSYLVIEELVAHLRERQWVEVRGTTGGGSAGHYLGLSRRGEGRVREALARSSYVGPAPVSLDELCERIESQSIHGVRVTKERVRAALADLTLADDVLGSLGPALSSGRSFFLFGPPGNGKTAVSARLGAVLGEPMYVPHAVEVDGEIIAVYDSALHRRVDAGDDAESSHGAPGYDRRYVRVERPVVITSGELQLEDLDLRFDPVSRVYRAPAQLKAMGGVLVLDDFGRQRASPSEIFSRWILPLEHKVDYLTLHTGFKFRIPFDCLLVFASNQDPEDLAEEAFTRRVQYKIRVGDPDRDAYAEIFAREAAQRGVPYEPAVVDWIYANYYEACGIPPRGCHPRDLLRLVQDLASYEERDPDLDTDVLSLACSTYFGGRGATRRTGTEARA